MRNRARGKSYLLKDCQSANALSRPRRTIRLEACLSYPTVFPRMIAKRVNKQKTREIGRNTNHVTGK